MFDISKKWSEGQNRSDDWWIARRADWLSLSTLGKQRKGGFCRKRGYVKETLRGLGMWDGGSVGIGTIGGCGARDGVRRGEVCGSGGDVMGGEGGEDGDL